MPQPIDAILDPEHDLENRILSQLGPGTLMMAGDNPALPKMPERPTILDFFRLRFRRLAVSHMLQSARNARKAGHDEKIVLTCLLHDVALGGLIRADHGYWGAQLIGPYVDEEVAWAVQYHQPLRYFADPAVNYEYPAAYVRFWGPDYAIPDYLKRDYEAARKHRWYGSARAITLFDLLFLRGRRADRSGRIRGYRRPAISGKPKEGLRLRSNSPVAHMWRSIIWPTNFL